MTGILLSLLGGKVPAVPDPYFEYTTLLLPGNGTNGAQNNTFLDSSSNNFTITRNGNTTQGTFSPFSQTGWGNYFSGSGSYISVATNAAFNFGTGDATVEFWFNPSGAQPGNYPGIVSSSDYNTSGSSSIRYSNTGYSKKVFMYLNGGGDPVIVSASTVEYGVWAHVAIVRQGTSLKLYLNGSLDASVTISASLGWNLGYGSLRVGRGFDVDGAGGYFNGYLSNIRLVKGVAVYSGAFIPPTSALTATQSAGTNIAAITTGQTSLLTCQSNRFVDNGQGNIGNTGFTITTSGSPSVQAFSPFNPNLSWSAATYGGSGYFDGNGDYLTIPVNTAINFGTGDFTVEAWVYPTATPGDGSGPLVGVTGNMMLAYQASGSSWAFGRNFVAWDISFNQAPILNTWQHIAVSRSGTLLRCFFNGKLVNSATNTNSYILTGGGYVGWNGTTGYFTGYMTNIRTVANALYTADFTPPTAPLTAITNTSLLLNFTNAGIYDATSKNDLETVGNAQISTTQSKWGGSSMAFDGSGDWLKSPANIFIEGTEAFTVECWMNLSNVSSTKGIIVGLGSNSFGLRVGQSYLGNVNGLNIVKSGVGDLDYCSFTFATSTWYHIAVCRSGTTIYFFVNGQQQTTQGSGAGSFSFTKPTSFYVGCNNDTNENFAGYLQDLRVTKGYARYTANFTAPTSPFPLL